jgi:hypothetical protein
MFKCSGMSGHDEHSRDPEVNNLPLNEMKGENSHPTKRMESISKGSTENCY